jgi:hypothetical protein
MDPDPNPAIFVTDLQDAIKKLLKKISCLLLLKINLYNFSKKKSPKVVTTVGIKVFLIFMLDDGRIRFWIYASA